MNKKFKELFSYLAIIAGALIASFSVACILLPNDAIDYGTAGIAIIISRLTGYNLSLCVFIVFLPFLAAGIFLLGKHFFAKTFIGFIVYTFGLAYFEKKIVPYLKKDNYYAAVKSYADHTEELLEMAAEGKPFNKRQHSMKYILCVVAGALLLPLILAYFMMHKKLCAMKTAVKEDNAANYMKPNSMNLDFSRDIFLYSTVTKTEKPKSNSGSHTSSSGRSHGGRGGSF